MFTIQEQIDVAEIRRRTAIDDNFVEHQNVRRWKGVVHSGVSPTVRVAFRFLMTIVFCIFSDDDATQTTTQRQCSVTFEHIRHLLLKVVKLEWCQEAQRAQMERHDGRHGLLKQERGIEKSSVASEADDEINAIGQVIAAVSKIRK